MINTELINDLLQANLISYIYFEVCSLKGYKPDSIRKYLQNLNKFHALVIQRSELSLPYLSKAEIVLSQKNVTKGS